MIALGYVFSGWRELLIGKNGENACPRVDTKKNKLFQIMLEKVVRVNR